METITVYVSIGNSDDKLTQERWAEFFARTSDAVQTFSRHVHGEWASLPNARWQNACWCFEPHPDDIDVMREVLAKLASRFGQDSIAWAVATTEFVKPAG